MTQKLLDRAEISRRLTEIDKLSAISPDTVPIERLPELIDQQHSATAERDRLLLILKQLDKRESADVERDRVASIQQEIQKLTVESDSFQASLPEKSKQIEALAIVYAEALLKLQNDGRAANFKKSRVFLLQKQLQGGQIERFDSIPTALHMPETITISILVADPRPGIEFHTGTPWVVEATTIERVLEGKSLGEE